MSDTPQGDGWWQTTDGRWHAPDHDPTAEVDLSEADAIEAHATETDPSTMLRPGEFGLPSEPPTGRREQRGAPARSGSASPTGSTTVATDGLIDGEAPGNRRPVAIWAAAAGILLIVAVVAFLLLRPGSDDESGEAADDRPASTSTTPASTEPTEANEPTEPTVASIAPGERLPPLSFDGTGDAVVAIDPPGPRVARITHTGAGPFVVRGLGADQQVIDVLVDHEGEYTGAVAVDFRDEQDTRSLEVSSAAPWQIEMVPVESLLAEEGAFSGKGDAVVLYGGDVGPVQITHDGSGPFRVNTFEIKTRDIETLVDQTGAFDDTVELRGPAFVWINADGAWSVTPR